MQVWTGKLSEIQLPVQNPAREGACTMDGRTHRQTDAGNDNTRRPKLASGKNKIEDQTNPKSIGILTILKCIFGPNMKILIWIGSKLSCGEAQNGVNFDF